MHQMEYTIHSSVSGLTLTAGTFGGELHSLKDRENRELIWQAGSIWNRHAPVCCPWCGSIQDGCFTDEGKEYHGATARHGFVRDLEHEYRKQETENQIVFHLNWPGDPEKWPWAFTVETVHALTEDGMRTVCTVENVSERPMPLQFGFHPAFTCPFLPGSEVTDYLFRFESGRVIPLVREMFDNDSILYHGTGKWVRLEHEKTGTYLQVDTAGFPNVLLWSKPGIPGFVCIEPWSGYENDSHLLMNRPGTIRLEPQEKRTWTLALTVQL